MDIVGRCIDVFCNAAIAKADGTSEGDIGDSPQFSREI